MITKLWGSAGSAAAVPRRRQQRKSLRHPNITAARLQCIENMTMQDELTGVFNRRFLMQAIRKEALRCDRNGADFAMCILDVDHF